MTRSTALLLSFAAAVLVAACDSSNNPMTLPPPTPTPAPTAGPVTVKAVSNSQVVPGVAVVLSDETGAFVAQTQTDAAGQASFTLAAGAKGMVTVVGPDTSGFSLIRADTYMDVGPGDKIEALVLTDSNVAPLGAFVVDFPDRPPEGTQLVTIDAGCAGTGFVFVKFQRLQGYVVNLNGNCGGATTTDVKITAVNGDRLLLAYSVQTGVPFAPNTKTPLTFPDGWRTDLTPLTIAYKNVPAGFPLLELSTQTFRADLDNVGAYSQLLSVEPGAAGSNTLYYSKALVNSLFYAATLYTNDSGVGPILSIAKTPVSISESGSVDFATDLPPVLNQPQLTDVNTFRPGITWSAAGDLSSTDVGIVQFSWKRGQAFVSWAIDFPPGFASPVRIPELPDNLAYARPTGDAGTTISSLVFYGDSTIDGYRGWIGPRSTAPLTVDARFASTGWFFPFL
jgi:hypothetical protein